MSTPDWKIAPRWANYVAQDADGDWFWYENKPIARENEWVEGTRDGRIASATGTATNWDQSLESRP